MKRTVISILIFSAITAAPSCSKYDDSSLWKQVDAAQKQIAELKASLEQLDGQVGLLVAAKTGGVINSVAENAGGGLVITYTDADGKTATAEIAAAGDIKSVDIISTKEEGGVLYWTLTAGGKTAVLTDKDGAKIPVAGRAPSFTADKDGYWMVNGSYITDSNGDKIKSSGHKASLIGSVTKNADGTVTLGLADGSSVTMNTADSFALGLFLDGEELGSEVKVADGTEKLIVTYKVTGSAASGAVVRVLRCENVEAAVDEASSAVNVTIPSALGRGSLTIVAAGEDGHFAARQIRLRGTFSVDTENSLWETVEEKILAPGCCYYAMEFKSLARKMKVLEIDLSNPAIEIATSFADDLMPNPNANKNGNNGFNLRETLSQLCARKTAAGENVIAGVNTGFFDSNDGILRGPHIENGEILYMNDPEISTRLSNHAWAFTVFKDNTASCGKKTFTGTVQMGGKEYRYYSVNDTLSRGGNSSKKSTYPIRLHTSRYVKTPHASNAAIVNPLATDALYVVAEYSGSVMQVNEGWAEAKVTALYDGRKTALSEAPYLTGGKEVAVQIYGTAADEVAAAVKAGDVIKLKAEMDIEGVGKKPILVQNSTMWHYVTDGKNTLSTVPASHDFRTKSDPMTFVCVDKSLTKVMIVEIDGRTTVSTGVTAAEVTEIALRLGAWNSTRFDGGGSSAMWAKKDGVSALVSSPSDSGGERSCMNYIYVRQK